VTRLRRVVRALLQRTLGPIPRQAFMPIERFEPRLSFEAGAAYGRGLRLLRENLSRSQRDQYERSGYFDVTGGETGRRYRIKHGSQMNVEELDGHNRTIRCLCFMPEGDLVTGDVMLAQKLALELFELEALAIANRFPPDLAAEFSYRA
jgi:hypothetical protein